LRVSILASGSSGNITLLETERTRLLGLCADSAKRFGNMHTEEAWLVLYFRWTRFPWNQYLRTSIAITAGPSFAVDLPRNAHDNAAILNYFSPEITFALPQYPQYELMVQMHHRSNFADIGKGGTPDPGWQFLTVGLRYRF